MRCQVLRDFYVNAFIRKEDLMPILNANDIFSIIDTREKFNVQLVVCIKTHNQITCICILSISKLINCQDTEKKLLIELMYRQMWS